MNNNERPQDMEKDANLGSAETTRAIAPAETLSQNIRRSLSVPQFVLFLIVLVLLAVGGIINPRFLGVDNMKIVTRDIAILAIAAIGVGFPILTAGIDLSAGWGHGGLLHDAPGVSRLAQHPSDLNSGVADWLGSRVVRHQA
jgi:predicted ABC-type sugar transport system permease subunit